MLKKLFSIVLFSAFCVSTNAQEFNCKVKVLSAAILNVDKQVFSTMEKSIADFMNTRKWTTEEYAANERIDVNIMLNLTSKATDDDLYGATLTIQSSRPVFNASYTSPIVNFVDKDVVFRYSQFTPFQFDDNRVVANDPMASNITAILAYYAYLVLGLDYDSFSPNGGSAFFKRAQNVVNNAPEEKGIAGWKAVEGNRNRYWIVDQILSPRFQEVRNYFYTMHREGFDKMAASPEEARQKILSGIPKLNQVNKENPTSILLQFFFNAKSDELARVVSQLPKEQRASYVAMLSSMDVPNVNKYQALNK
ncbi:MAG TPA: DUF4835 family protein [Flavipsychrobacter sp.]|nr:DUF4835 family protein [Flavipsychrobacter sp.]